MNRTLLKWLLAVSLSLNIGFIGAVVFRQAQTPAVPSATTPSPHLNLPDYLQLSGEQRQRWQQLEPAFLHDLTANWREIRSHREALVRAIFAAAPERATIDAQQAQIAALQSAQQQRVITQLLAEREVLNAKQRTRLMELLLGRYAQEATEEELLHREEK
ncbi:MAG: periplasmic heavy metal sensor [Rhodoferax sp.]